MYGTVTGVCDDPPIELLPTKPPPLMMGADKVLKRLNRDSDSLMCRQRLRIYRKQVTFLIFLANQYLCATQLLDLIRSAAGN